MSQPNREYYAIKHKPTGFMLPAGGKGLKGHTHQEPSEIRPPRLFVSFVYAKRALSAYVDGKWYDVSTGPDHNGEYDYTGPEPKKNTKRNSEDFEIVNVELMVHNA